MNIKNPFVKAEMQPNPIEVNLKRIADALEELVSLKKGGQ